MYNNIAECILSVHMAIPTLTSNHWRVQSGAMFTCSLIVYESE